jgi:predicted unusual protein kinase regulating ubiquinone biosynthesis (AarF/ABC1/UbiB family)
MSTQDDFVPKQYMKWVKNTQDNVPNEFTGTEARAFVALKLKEELGLIFDDVFESWDDIPLGEVTEMGLALMTLFY